MQQEVEGLPAGYSPEVQGLARKLRTMIRSLIPKATEQMDASAKIIAYGEDGGYDLRDHAAEVAREPRLLPGHGTARPRRTTGGYR